MKNPPLRILVTAGPTREYLDPVRFISNESTGVMGVACTQEAYQRGHEVKLICGPVSLPEEERGNFAMIPVVTAREMLSALQRELSRADALIMAAAVADFRPARKAVGKMSKEGKKKLTVKLVRNPDILKILSRKKGARCLVGFSLETKKGIKNGWRKLQEKRLDLIVCNRFEGYQVPFGDREVTVALLDREGRKEWLRGVSKAEVAKALLDKVEQICYQRRGKGG